MSVAMIRGNEAVAAIFASQNASAIGSQHDSRRVARVDHDIVDHDIRIAHTDPSLARVAGLPKAFRGSGIHNRGVGWILLQHTGAACGKRNALNFLERIARALAFVNTGASAGEYD